MRHSLADAAPGTPVLALDRPGWDGSRPAADLEGNARRALAALDAAGAARAVVAGHSLGGAVAAWLAATRPERVAALVLAAPAANLASLYALDRWLAAPLAGEISAAASLGGLGVVLGVPSLRRRIAGAAGLDPEYLERAGRLMRQPRAWRSYSAEQRALVHDLPELERRLSAITAPTTILSGSSDRIVPAAAIDELSRQVPGSALRVIGGAGHLLPQTRPREVADALWAAVRAVAG